ncbi:Secondary metabolism regulator laeA [Colletotrichum aenigma]|uniref:Secondary metabolism regulator laeA n=1 Tax=Colletotrichum aenigma TaxID=1215731 RepID=UPI00187244ED|nr:Secondary metabolism regulator laeA [Colletotrichum aenigma]KAF5524901.1 Secondary metabolism regulator laeA [Colletotrichum aenigma]
MAAAANLPDLTPLAPEEADEGVSETGSANGSSGSSLASLRSSILEHRRENGRRYHGMSEGTYILPNDEQEQERLDINHHLWRVTWDGDLCRSPKRNGANRVLDLGTGTGIWSIEYAEDHPEATVIGVDLSPIQPEFVPPNCKFEIDDVDKDWTWSTLFDFIFVRHMNACFASWERMLAQAYENLEPGGYIELQDNSFPLACQDGTLRPGSALERWSSLIMEGTAKMGRPVTVPAHFKRMLQDAGFVDVVEEYRVWPVNDWPRNDALRLLGRWSQFDSLEAVESSALALFTRVLGWTRAEVLVFCAEVRNELKDRSIHAYWNVWCAYGRKPLKEQTPAEEQTPGA